MKKDGGPAFPVVSGLVSASNVVDGGYGGMSLRDYFATHAPHEEIMEILQGNGRAGKYAYLDFSWARYIWADEMLKFRQEYN